MCSTLADSKTSECRSGRGSNSADLRMPIKDCVQRIKDCQYCVHFANSILEQFVNSETGRLRESAYLYGRNSVDSEDLARLDDFIEGAKLIVSVISNRVEQFKVELNNYRKEEFGTK